MSLFPGNPNPRPTKLSEDMVLKVVKQLAELLYSWAPEWSDDELIETAQYLYKQIDYSGYELAKKLEDKFLINPNSQLVELLEDIPYIKREALDEQVKAWVAQEHIEPKHKVGAEVKVNVKYPSNIAGEYVGIIRNIEHSTAKYIIGVPALGDVAPGSGNGTTGRYFNFEDVEGWHAE